MANEIAYYSMETSHFNDVKIKRLRRTHGSDGYAIWAYVLNEIYRINHYYMLVDENTLFDIEDYWGIPVDKITEVINFCVEIGLFDKGIYENQAVLTSNAIQLRYVEMCKRTHRKVAIADDLLLLLTDIQQSATDGKTANSNDIRQSPTMSDNVEQSLTMSNQVEQSPTKSDNVEQSSTKSENVVLNKKKINNITPFIPLAGGNTSPTKSDNSSFENTTEGGQRSTAPRPVRKNFDIDRNNPPSWVAPDMLQSYADWLEYKTEKGQGYKSEKSAKACYEQLFQLASGNSQTAQAIVVQSIASNYTGLFPLKNSNFQAQQNNFIVRNTQTKVYTKF